MDRSLSEVNASVNVQGKSFWKRLLTFTGPAFMIAVGYMDPGNWATDIAGGSRFGYQLIWVVLLANLFAVMFQTISARLGIVYGRDLAQACRDHYPKVVNYALWIVCEVAIAACDLAEVLGSAIGLYLLFHIPLFYGVIITTVVVILLMSLMSFGIRKMEAFILALITTIGLCFAVEMFFTAPQLSEIAKGFMPGALNGEGLFIALGIIGATLMPHNLYLHSALVQSRNVNRTREGLKEANKFNFIDSAVALNGAFLVNAAILILAASAFFSKGHTEVASIIDAHKLLAPLLGTSAAPILFGLALLAAGQSSTITGTFAGQVVMEGFVGIKVRPWLRRLITRLIAVVPTVFIIGFYGDRSVEFLLILSQVLLSLQLPFALIPLLHFTGDKNKMGEFVTKWWIQILAWGAACFIIILNLKLVSDMIIKNISDPTPIGNVVRFVFLPVSVVLLPLLIWVISEPLIRKVPLKFKRGAIAFNNVPEFSAVTDFKRIGIALEGNKDRDAQIIARALPFLKTMGADILLVNIVQTVAGRFIGGMVADSEAVRMKEYLENMGAVLKDEKFHVTTIVGGGEPEDEIVRIAKEYELSLIVAGSHGHKFLTDLLFGETIDGVRHRSRLPVLAIPVS